MSPARMLITLGLVLVALGIAWTFADKIGLGRLPGDIFMRRKGVTIYIPIVSSIVVSLLLTLLLNLFKK